MCIFTEGRARTFMAREADLEAAALRSQEREAAALVGCGSVQDLDRRDP